MSLFSWLFPTRKPPVRASQPSSSGLSRVEPTRPVGKRQAFKDAYPNGQPANRKGERMARRELLYGVVREAMMRAGVLSAGYKFKVLSLDGRGRQFLVMVDLARDHGSDPGRLAEIEALIAQAAKSRHDIVVTAVYWRASDYVAIGDVRQPRAADSQPAALDAPPSPPASQPAAVGAPPEPQPPARRMSPCEEPIQAEEVAAFKRALAAGVVNPAAAAAAAVGVSHGASAVAFDGSGVHGPRSYTLLTGFEDTEMPDGDHRAPVLSGTQYGDLN